MCVGLFLCYLFSGAAKISCYIASHGKMNYESGIRDILDRSQQTQAEALPRRLSEGTETNNENFTRNNRTSLATRHLLKRLQHISYIKPLSNQQIKQLRWSRGSVLAFGTQLRGFKPGRSRWIFQGEKILSTPSFGREVKPFVPSRRFTACKRSLDFTWKSGIFRQKLIGHYRPSSSSFHYQGLWWRHLAVQV